MGLLPDSGALLGLLQILRSRPTQGQGAAGQVFRLPSRPALCFPPLPEAFLEQLLAH